MKLSKCLLVTDASGHMGKLTSHLIEDIGGMTKVRIFLVRIFQYSQKTAN